MAVGEHLEVRLFTRYPVLRRVIVNLKTGKAFRGVLWERRGEYLVLRDAQMIREREGPLPVDGELVVDKTNVDFMQVIG